MKKTMMFVLVLIIAPCIGFAQPAGNVLLPEPETTGGMPLMDALSQRHSTREFSLEKIDLQTLSNLLWAADGFNRRDAKKRTAPSSMNYQEIDIYLAMENGLFLYDAWENQLIAVVDEDIRATAGTQDFVATAPLNLIYVADMKKVKEPESDYQQKASYANTGFIAQNVYLFCAANKLGAVTRAYFDEKELAEAMLLADTKKIILSQTVGYPAD